VGKGLLHTISKQDLQALIDQSSSLAEVLRKLRYSLVGSSYGTLRSKLSEFEIDIEPLEERRLSKWRTSLAKAREGKTVDNAFVQNSKISRKTVRKKILRENLIEYSCAVCSISEWRGSTLSLQLDHINGVSNDHRLENLRFLCPNCHSQTETFAGRNKPKSSPHMKESCSSCQEPCSVGSNYCQSCWEQQRPTKIQWPEIDELEERVSSSSYVQVARELGVSDNAVRKRIAKFKTA
jgi:Zn finger protein HypA/HybF involved in hydrogenase expression